MWITIQFHQRIAKLLRKHQIITDMSEEAMVENDPHWTVYAARYRPSAGPAGA